MSSSSVEMSLLPSSVSAPATQPSPITPLRELIEVRTEGVGPLASARVEPLVESAPAESGFWRLINLVRTAFSKGKNIHKDDEEGEVEEAKKVPGAKKVKIQREDPGPKQFAILGAGIGSTSGLLYLLRNEGAISAALSSAFADLEKESYVKVPADSRAQTVFRAKAVACLLIAAAVLTISKVTGSDNAVLQVLKIIPFADIALTILVRCDLKKLKPEAHLRRLLAKCGIEVSKTQAEVINSVAQGALASGLMAPFFGSTIVGIGANLTKTQMRSLTDVSWKQMSDIEDPRMQKIWFGSVYAATAVVAVGSLAAMQVVENPYAKVGCAVAAAPALDILARTFKGFIKAFIEAARGDAPSESKLQTVANILGVVLAVSALSYFIGTQSNTSSAFVALLYGLIFTSLKISAKAVLPKSIALPSMAGMVALCTILYLFTQDQRNQPWYGTFLAADLFFINMCLYLIVPFLRGDEKPIAAIEEIGDSDTGRLLAGTEEAPVPKEKKKKDKKEKKEKDLESAESVAPSKEPKDKKKEKKDKK